MIEIDEGGGGGEDAKKSITHDLALAMTETTE